MTEILIFNIQSKIKMSAISLYMHYFTVRQILQSAKLTKSEIKYEYTYLVFSIFKNCKISENCINLKALKNLKPVRQKDHKEITRDYQ